MKDFRSWSAIFSATARFLHSSLFSFSLDRFSAAAFSCARNLAAGFAAGPIGKVWFCAMAASGHAAAAPPRSLRNARRLMQPPRPRTRHCTALNQLTEVAIQWSELSALAQKRICAVHKLMSVECQLWTFQHPSHSARCVIC